MQRIREHMIPVFCALTACSWVPHWACHYYRLETGTSFVVGSWSFSPLESSLSMIVYGVLILGNLIAVSAAGFRVPALSLAGLGHLLIGSVHVVRLWRPFPFLVFGYPWSQSASLREVLIVIPFGILCLLVARRCLRLRGSPTEDKMLHPRSF